MCSNIIYLEMNVVTNYQSSDRILTLASEKVKMQPTQYPASFASTNKEQNGRNLVAKCHFEGGRKTIIKEKARVTTHLARSS